MKQIEYNVLDHGYVRLLNASSGDIQIADYAGICTGKFDVNNQVDPETAERRINRLMEMGHTSPFEFADITFVVKAPIFIARQWMRHRTFSYLEQSGRYTTLADEVYDPTDGAMQSTIAALFELYDNLIKVQGVPKEQARGILPLSTYTTFIFKTDLHNLFHFLQLRLDSRAQKEMQEYAKAVYNITKVKYPICCAAFDKYILRSHR